MLKVLNPYAPDDVMDAEVEVLVWNEHWYEPHYETDLVVETPAGREISLKMTRDRERRAAVDAIWFHLPTMVDWPDKCNGERWVLASMEADSYYPFQASPASYVRFDLRMTHRLDADIPCPYANRREYSGFRQPTRPRAPDAGALACFIASHPLRWRDDYVRELMEYVPIDSFGTCLNNADISDVVAAGMSRGDEAMAAIASYPFYLAFESCREHDYVTEKLYRPLSVGTVPVYWGAPNVNDFIPSPDAVIRVEEHTSPRELAELLEACAADPERAARHLAAVDERPPHFEALLDLGDVDPRARLATKLAHRCDHTCGCGGRNATKVTKAP